MLESVFYVAFPFYILRSVTVMCDRAMYRWLLK